MKTHLQRHITELVLADIVLRSANAEDNGLQGGDKVLQSWAVKVNKEDTGIAPVATAARATVVPEVDVGAVCVQGDGGVRVRVLCVLCVLCVFE